MVDDIAAEDAVALRDAFAHDGPALVDVLTVTVPNGLSRQR